MVKKENKRVIATLTPKNFAKLQYLLDKTGLKVTGIVNLAVDYYYDLLRKE